MKMGFLSLESVIAEVTTFHRKFVHRGYLCNLHQIRDIFISDRNHSTVYFCVDLRISKKRSYVQVIHNYQRLSRCTFKVEMIILHELH